MKRRYVISIVTLILLWSLGAFAQSLYVPGISIRVGPATIAVPNKSTQPFDSPFVEIGGTNYGFTTWGGTTYQLSGSSLTSFFGPTGPAVLVPGGSGQGFDTNGAWLHSVDPQQGNVVYGWYHAETPNSYGGVNRSMAYAASTNGGLSFNQNQGGQVVANNSECNVPNCGEGDGTVIKWSGYYYLYAQRSDSSISTIVARAPLSSQGGPEVGISSMETAHCSVAFLISLAWAVQQLR